MGMDTNRERIAAYLRTAGLESIVGREADVERGVRDLLEAMTEKVALEQAASLYTYSVPMLTADGTCSVVDELAPVPYDLTGILGGRSEQTTRRLALLARVVERARETTGADWVGKMADARRAIAKVSRAAAVDNQCIDCFLPRNLA